MSGKDSIADRLREIDALIALGGLERSPHQKAASVASTQVPIVSPGASAFGRRTAKPSLSIVLRVPEWEQHPWLAQGFSTRLGGVSTVYRPGKEGGDLNLGMTAADTPESVEKNRELFLSAVLTGHAATAQDRKQPELVLLRQIHSGLVHRIRGSDAGITRRGDGLIAAEPGRILGIQTADCIPVLVVDVRKRVVAAFHAGWRGTLARIVERGVGRMRAEFGCRPSDLTAAIGPGIGRCCYSVGEEVRMEFQAQFEYSDELFEEVFDLDPVKQKYPMLFLTARAPGHSNLGPSLHLDLPEANRRQLLDAGLMPKSIHMSGMCTACDTERFFSHRAEQGFTGRMLSVIGVVDKGTHGRE